eukprot:10978629-Alexandrium_andersonii.AAC.1
MLRLPAGQEGPQLFHRLVASCDVPEAPEGTNEGAPLTGIAARRGRAPGSVTVVAPRSALLIGLLTDVA